MNSSRKLHYQADDGKLQLPTFVTSAQSYSQHWHNAILHQSAPFIQHGDSAAGQYWNLHWGQQSQNNVAGIGNLHWTSNGVSMFPTLGQGPQTVASLQLILELGLYCGTASHNMQLFFAWVQHWHVVFIDLMEEQGSLNRA